MQRGHRKNPEASALEAELGENKAGREGREGQGTDGEIEESDEVEISGGSNVSVHFPETARVEGEESEDNRELNPLGRFADECEEVLV